MHSKLAVLGGGPGGYAAAFLAADLGMEVTIVEQEPTLGGVCLLRGCIPSKALLHVARVISESHEMADWGVKFERPKIDIDAMRARKEKVISTLTNGLRQLATSRKVRVVHAWGTFDDSQTLRLHEGDPNTYEDDQLTFDKMILAVGSRPVIPSAFDLKSDRVMDSTGALELADVPSSLLVVGGGYIGLEMGTVYAELSSEVTVVEMTDGLLPGADRDLVKPLQKRLSKLFKAIHLSHKVASLTEVENGIEAKFEGPDGEKTERYDRVLVSIGRRPNSDGIGLEKTEVEVDSKGFVVVDEKRQSTDANIFAIGDVAGEPMLAHKASHEGKVAVEAIHGGPAKFDKLAIPAVVFTDPELAWAGLTQSQAKEEGRKVDVTQYPWAASGRAQALGRTDGLTKFIVDPETERILGVGIVGPGAGELISEGVLAIEMGCTVRDVSESIHPHPTLSETLSFSAESFYGIATEIHRPKRRK